VAHLEEGSPRKGPVSGDGRERAVNVAEIALRDESSTEGALSGQRGGSGARHRYREGLAVRAALCFAGAAARFVFEPDAVFASITRATARLISPPVSSTVSAAVKARRARASACLSFDDRGEPSAF